MKMNSPKPSRKFAIIFDDLDETTINKNVGLFAQFIAEQGIGVDFITAKLPKNTKVEFNQKNINIIKIPASKKWPQLQAKHFLKYFDNNINKYFCVWVYRGRPYTEHVVDVASKRNVLTLIKLDSDVSVSQFGKLFFSLSKALNINEKKLYSASFFLLKILSIIPSVRGFMHYDSILFRSSLVLCESKKIANIVRKKIPNSRAFYFPNAIPVKKYNEYTNIFKHDGYKKKNLIISVGRIVPVKQYEQAIVAFSMLSKKIQSEWNYEIIGPAVDKEYNKLLLKLIKSLNLERKVKMTGGLFDKNLFLKYFSSSILLMPYKEKKDGVEMEGQPNVIPQGMFFKNAPVVTSLSGTRHFIKKNEQNGILLSSNNPEEIKKGIEILIADKKALLSIQENAYKKICTEFNLDKLAEEVWRTILDMDYELYLQDQKSDTLALEPEVIKKAVYKYLDFLTKKIKNINFKSAKILDVGCREFYTYDYFLKKYENLIQGIEIGPEALDFSKRKNITEVDIHEMTSVFKYNSFDVILSFHVLEHMYDLSVALKNCRAILKKNGILFFAIPMPSHDTRRSHWLSLANQKEMIKLLGESGFKSVFYKTYPADVFRNEPEMIGIFKKI